MKQNSSLLFFGFPIPVIARKTNLPAVTVWRHVTGERKISAEIAVKYSKALGIPLSELRPDLWAPDPAPTPAQEPADAQDSA